jgi:hypothetical protein
VCVRVRVMCMHARPAERVKAASSSSQVLCYRGKSTQVALYRLIAVRGGTCLSIAVNMWRGIWQPCVA